MKNITLRKAVETALWTTLVFLATFAVRLSSPIGGYFNVGDPFVILGAWLLGPWLGAVAAGVGSFMADFAGGSLYFGPGSLIVKALIAILAYFSAKGFAGLTRNNYAGWSIGAVLGELWMCVGYALYAGLFLGRAWWLSIPVNLFQGLVGVIGAIVLAAALMLIPQFKETLNMVPKGDKDVH